MLVCLLACFPRSPTHLRRPTPARFPAAQHPHTPAQIWDLFVRCPEASLEERFATFCDQLGDFLEGLVQRAVDVLELFFQLDAAEQQVGGRASRVAGWVAGWKAGWVGAWKGGRAGK